MLRIRLQRVGRKHEPTFRLVLTESRNSTKSGKFFDVLGSYDPRTDKPQFNAEKIKEWIGKGARVTGTVHNLLISQGIIKGKKINVLPRKSPPKKEEDLVSKVDSALLKEESSLVEEGEVNEKEKIEDNKGEGAAEVLEEVKS